MNIPRHRSSVKLSLKSQSKYLSPRFVLLNGNLIWTSSALRCISVSATSTVQHALTIFYLESKTNPAQNHKERKAAFLMKLINVFKIAAWVIPGSAKRAAFEDTLNPFFKSMEETEGAWKKLPDFTTVSLCVISQGEDLADSR